MTNFFLIPLKKTKEGWGYIIYKIYVRESIEHGLDD